MGFDSQKMRERKERKQRDLLSKQKLRAVCIDCGHVETGTALNAIAAMKEHRRDRHPDRPPDIKSRKKKTWRRSF